MGTTFTRNSFIRENRLHHKLKYIEKMEVLMKLLIEQEDYTGVAGYCNDILKVYPDCVDIHFSRIIALYKQGYIDSVRESYENLRELHCHELSLYSRKLAYVGMSRPKKLLCVAMQDKTYEKSKGVFTEDWEIIDLRE